MSSWIQYFTTSFGSFRNAEFPFFVIIPWYVPPNISQSHPQYCWFARDLQWFSAARWIRLHLVNSCFPSVASWMWHFDTLRDPPLLRFLNRPSLSRPLLAQSFSDQNAFSFAGRLRQLTSKKGRETSGENLFGKFNSALSSPVSVFSAAVSPSFCFIPTSSF